MEIINYSAKAIAVIGDTKPIRNELKKLGGKFNPKLSCGAGWIFSAKKRADVEKLLSGNGNVISTKNDAVNDKELLDEYLAEYSKVCVASSLDYYRKEFSSAIRLENGGILVFEKPRIETSFCFGYHLSQYDTKDYDNANKMAEYASKSESYFLERNLEEFDRIIEQIETGKRDGFQNVFVCVNRRSYGDTILNVYDWHVFDHYSYEENNKYGQQRGIEYQIANDTDKTAILDALKRERSKFEKRLKAYLKRYGTSKLKVWSYWRDA